MTTELASLAFIGVWTAIVVGAGFWSWRRWLRSRTQRIIKTWFGEIDEADFPFLFGLLSASELVGVFVAGLLGIVGMVVFASILGR